MLTITVSNGEYLKNTLLVTYEQCGEWQFVCTMCKVIMVGTRQSGSVIHPCSW